MEDGSGAKDIEMGALELRGDVDIEIGDGELGEDPEMGDGELDDDDIEVDGECDEDVEMEDSEVRDNGDVDVAEDELSDEERALKMTRKASLDHHRRFPPKRHHKTSNTRSYNIPLDMYPLYPIHAVFHVPIKHFVLVT